MPPKAELERTQSPNDTIEELKEKLSEMKGQLETQKSARASAAKERDEVAEKFSKLQAKQADNNAVFSRLERELALGSTSPMDWDRTGKIDLVERVMNAFKTKAGGDASLKSAHETLIRQHQALATQLQEERAKPKPTEPLAPGAVPEAYHAHVSAPEKGDIHIHLHIV